MSNSNTLFSRIHESIPTAFLVYGALIGLTEGTYNSVTARQFAFFSTVRIVQDNLALRILNVFISSGIRANWYSNFGTALDAAKKGFAMPCSLTNKEIGHMVGMLLGIGIYLYLMSQLKEKSLNQLFHPADYSQAHQSKTHLFVSVLQYFDQMILISGGLSNLFGYNGTFIDTITQKKTLVHGLQMFFPTVSTTQVQVQPDPISSEEQKSGEQCLDV